MKNRARISILSELLSFATIRNKDWEEDRLPPVGSLVAMSSAPTSKWYLSWVIEIDNREGYPRYLLESIEDGVQCWWTNVGINKFNPQRIKERPEWRWTDKQFTLRDRWRRVLKEADAYIVLGGDFDFKTDGSLYISLRIRHNFDPSFNYNKTFPDWKKVTIKMMSEFYDAGCKSREKN